MMAFAPSISPGVLGIPYPAQKLGLPDSIAAVITDPLPCERIHSCSAGVLYLCPPPPPVPTPFP